MINRNVMFGLMRMKGLTVDDVAKCIGISKASFREYFLKLLDKLKICAIMSLKIHKM